jgi:hypothetical protein
MNGLRKNRQDYVKLLFKRTTSVLKTQAEKDFYSYLNKNAVPWAEIYIPVQVDEEGVWSATQLIFSGGTPDEAAQRIEDTADKWRSLDASGVEKFTKWSSQFTK